MGAGPSKKQAIRKVSKSIYFIEIWVIENVGQAARICKSLWSITPKSIGIIHQIDTLS
jgi:hypothetical protein